MVAPNKCRARSAVRVKVVIVWAIFVSCCVVIRFAGLSPGWEDTLFVIAAIDAVSIYFIRCEQCRDRLVSLRTDKVLSLWRIIVPQETCPKCGVERI
jgi:hypothetical protein